jgi:hypothetical protein
MFEQVRESESLNFFPCPVSTFDVCLQQLQEHLVFFTYYPKKRRAIKQAISFCSRIASSNLDATCKDSDENLSCHHRY